MEDKGWVKLYRSIQDNFLWSSDEPFDRRSAWIYLILVVGHEDRQICVNGSPLDVKRGQKFTSIRKLSCEWHWSRDKVSRFLNTLHKSGMISIIGTHNGTLITIEKYAEYQDVPDTKQATDKATGKATGMTSTRPPVRHKQEDKNNKNDKKRRNNNDASPENDENISPEGVAYQ